MPSLQGESETVVVLGGGVGGLVAANRLRERLARDHRVVLVDREADHVFQPSLLWLAVGDRTPDRIQRPLDRLRRRGIEVVTGEIRAIDPAARRVRVSGRDIVRDALIVSLGADLAPDAIPGLAAARHDLYTLDGAVAVRDAITRLRAGRIVILTATPAYKCPAAPCETAMLIAAALRRRGVREGVSIDVYAAEPGPMLGRGSVRCRPLGGRVKRDRLPPRAPGDLGRRRGAAPDVRERRDR